MKKTLFIASFCLATTLCFGLPPYGHPGEERMQEGYPPYQEGGYTPYQEGRRDGFHPFHDRDRDGGFFNPESREGGYFQRGPQYDQDEGRRREDVTYPSYNKKHEEKVEGEIVDITSRPSRKHGWNNIILTVRTDKGTIPVVLGPSWYIDEDGMILAPGAKIWILGASTHNRGKVLMVAREIRVGDHKLELRDSNGYKRWTGWSKS